MCKRVLNQRRSNASLILIIIISRNPETEELGITQLLQSANNIRNTVAYRNVAEGYEERGDAFRCLQGSLAENI